MPRYGNKCRTERSEPVRILSVFSRTHMDDGHLPDEKSSLSLTLRENIVRLVGSEVPVQFPRVNRETESVGLSFSNTCEGFDNMRAESITKNLVPEAGTGGTQ